VNDLGQLIQLAADLAAAASAIHIARLRTAKRVLTKSSGTDFVSDVDHAAEAAIVDGIRAARPQDSILAEEGSLHDGSTGVRWVIDPLDGTTNYLYGYPAFAASIGIEVDGAPAAGVVSESLNGDIYAAVAGGPATRNGKPIAVTGQDDLSRALISTGFSYSPQHRRHEAGMLVEIVEHIADLRRGGSAALDLCWLARGRMDAYFELDLKPWDYAAAGVIARCAGAEVRMLPAHHGYGPAIVAANPRLMPALVDLLTRAGVIVPEDERAPVSG